MRNITSTTKELASGIRFVSHANGVHIAAVDLRMWRPAVTPLTMKQLKDVEPASPLVVNGDRFGGGYDGNLSGINIADLTVSSNSARTTHETGIEFYDNGGRLARIRRPDPSITADDLLHEGVTNRLAGFPWLTLNGAINPLLAISKDPRLCNRHPRTITGLDTTGTVLFIIVVDGRTSHQPGMTITECAQLTTRLGIPDSVSHDGGSSSAFVSHGNYITNPSDWWEGDVYTWRRVGNALIMAPR